MFSSLNTIICDMSRRCYRSCRDGSVDMPDFECLNVHDYMLSQPIRYQLSFALSQVIAVSYFFWIYGASYHEIMHTYSKWLTWFINEKVAKSPKLDDADRKILAIIQGIDRYTFGCGWPTNVDVNLVRSFLFNDDAYLHVPYAMNDCTVTPYLMYRNSLIGSIHGVTVQAFEKPVELPMFNIWGYSRYFNMCVSSDRIGSGYDVMRINKRQGTDILRFLTGVINMPQYAERVITALARFNMHRDVTRIKTRTSTLSYAIAYALHGIFDVDFVNIASRDGQFTRTIDGINPKLRSYCYTLANDLIVFICAMNKTCGMTIDKELFLKLFGVDSLLRFQDKAVLYVRHAGTAEASEEDLRAYQESPLGSCEAIRLISLPASVAQGAGAEHTEQESTDGLEDDFNLTELPDIDIAEPGMEADEGDLPDTDEDASSDGDQSEDSDDSLSTDGGEDENEDTPNPESNPEENNDTASGDDVSSSTVNDTQPAGEPEHLEGTDDEEDIVFKVSPEGSETVDSVLIREELDQFLGDILANPPKKLSPQTVAALTALQRYWVHILSVETIIGLLGRLIVLPERIRNIQSSIKEKETNEQTV